MADSHPHSPAGTLKTLSIFIETLASRMERHLESCP